MTFLLNKIRGFLRDDTQQSQITRSTPTIPPLSPYDEWAWIPSPDFSHDLASYVFREWISTAIDRVAEIAVSVPIEVRDSVGRPINHPLLELIGRDGQPNPMQDSLEFLEAHFQRVDVYGNDIWYWTSKRGGSPDEVYQLDIRRVKIKQDGRNIRYYYNLPSGDVELNRNNITHFRRSNIVSSGMHWGLSAVQKLRNVVESDKAMTRWNMEFFQSGAPSGVLILDDTVSAEEAKRVEHEIHQQVTEKRRMVVIRAKQGGAVWNDANLKQREMEFQDGRMLTRQAAFDALGFHVGAVSEASTEAHARVAERFVRSSAYIRHMRTASRLNSSLKMWSGYNRYNVRFHDVRVVDWEQESRKLKAVAPYMTINEVREKYLDLEPTSWGDMPYESKTTSRKVERVDTEVFQTGTGITADEEQQEGG